MSSDEEDLLAEPQQLQPYTVDARWAQPATGEAFCYNWRNKHFDNQITQQHTGIMMNLKTCF